LPPRGRFYSFGQHLFEREHFGGGRTSLDVQRRGLLFLVQVHVRRRVLGELRQRCRSRIRDLLGVEHGGREPQRVHDGAKDDAVSHGAAHWFRMSQVW
jgi:hypothetical protein